MLIRLRQGSWSEAIDTTALRYVQFNRNAIVFPPRGDWPGYFPCENESYARQIILAIFTAWETGAGQIDIRHDLRCEYRNADGDELYKNAVLEINCDA